MFPVPVDLRVSRIRHAAPQLPALQTLEVPLDGANTTKSTDTVKNQIFDMVRTNKQAFFPPIHLNLIQIHALQHTLL